MTLLKNRPFFLVLLLLIITFLITLGNFYWLCLNKIPPVNDSAGHTNLSIIFTQVIRGKGKDIFPQGLIGLLKTSYYYPPFVLILGGLINLVFGFNYKNLQYFSVMLLPLSVLFLYLYGKRLTKSKWVGFFSAGFFILFPHVWQQSRYFMLDLPLTVLLTASLYFLEKSAGLKKPRSVFWFFLLAGLAQLTKWYAFVYLLVPFLFKVLPLSLNKLKKLAPYFLLTCLLISPWYLANFQTLLNETLFFKKAHFGNQPSLFSLRALLFYPTMLLNYQIVSLQFIWLIGALVIFLKSQAGFKKLFAGQIALVLILFSLLGNKNMRFLMPLLPFLAIIMGYSINLLRKNFQVAAWFIFACLTFFGIGLFTINSFSFPIKTNLVLAKQLAPSLDYVYLLDLSSKTVPYHWQKKSWSPEVVVKDLRSLTSQKKTKVLVVAENQALSVASLNIFSLPKDYHLQFFQLPFDEEKSLAGNNEIENYLNQFDYLLIPKNFSAPDWQINFNNLEAIRKYVLGGQTRKFGLIKTYSLPKDKLYLLKKDGGYNKLQISISNNKLTLKRKPAVARIYLQLMDKDEKWSQNYMTEKQTEYEKNIENIKQIRIDYPPNLWEIKRIKGWNWDQDKQLNKQ